MSTASEKIIQLGLEERLSIVNNLLNKLEKRLSKDEKPRLKRFHAVFGIFQDKLKGADIYNTRILVFERTSALCDSIVSAVGRLNDVNTQPDDRRAVLIQLDELADIFLEYLPQMQVTNSNTSIIGEAQQALEVISNHRDEIAKIRLETEKAFEETRNYKAQNETISEQLATKVLVGDFNERAKDEKRLVFFWTAVTGFFAFATVALLSYIFIYQIDSLIKTPTDTPSATDLAVLNLRNYQFLTTKVLLTVTFGLIAKWASKRANRHLIEESKYHRLAVNSATMKEFIATLPDNEKHVVISAVALKIFTEGTGNETSTEFEPSSLAELLKTAQAAVSKPG